MFYRERNKKRERERERLHQQSHRSGEALLAVTIMRCPYCQSKDSPDGCDVVTHVATRKANLRSQKRCFGCTRQGNSMKKSPGSPVSSYEYRKSSEERESWGENYRHWHATQLH